MPWSGLEGHDAVINLFQRAVEQDRLGHAYLFVGPEGIGKKSFALQLAKALCCEQREPGLVPCEKCHSCAQINANTYPDLQILGLPDDKHEFPVELMQTMISGLALKPSYQHGKRVAIIDDADVLNEESANCLLKTLEEPPPQSLLILIGTAAERQLPTIRSRCQLIRFQPLANDILIRLCQSTGICTTEKEAKDLAAMAQGSLANASLLADEEVSEWCKTARELLGTQKLNAADFAKKMNEFIEAAGKESAPKRRRASFAVEFIISLIRQSLLHLCDGKKTGTAIRLAERLGETTTMQLLERCIAAEHHIDRRFQLGLIVEALSDAIGQAMLPAA